MFFRTIEKRGDKLISTEYISLHKPLDIQCGECGVIYPKTFYYYHDRDMRCLKCFSENQYSQQEVENIIAKAGDKCEGKFISVNHYLSIKCGKCEKIFEMQFRHYLNGSRCSDCVAKEVGRLFALSYDTVRDYICDCGDFLVSETYYNYYGPLEICCGRCNHVYTKTFAQFKAKGRCDQCRDPMSRGERRVATCLTTKSLDYEYEYIFDDCRYILPLPFDFYIPSLSMCIEFQGQQHYEV